MHCICELDYAHPPRTHNNNTAAPPSKGRHCSYCNAILSGSVGLDVPPLISAATALYVLIEGLLGSTATAGHGLHCPGWIQSVIRGAHATVMPVTTETFSA